MQHALTLFATLLDYPTPDCSRQAQACAALVAETCPEAAALLGEFSSFAQEAPISQLEEIYTRTFDLKCLCYPYVGYHLVGESYRRGAFLARLNQGYQARGFSAGRELPDHISVVLRFLALDPEIGTARPGDEEFGSVLLHEGLAPALYRMRLCFDHDSDNPYARIVRALSIWVGGDRAGGG